MSDYITKTVGEVLALPGLSDGMRKVLEPFPSDYFVLMVDNPDGTTGLSVCPGDEHNKKLFKVPDVPAWTPKPLPMIPHLDNLIRMLIANGGAIVSSNDCSPAEIATARACGRFAVDDDGFGFVLRTKEWLSSVSEKTVAEVEKLIEMDPTEKAYYEALGTPGGPSEGVEDRPLSELRPAFFAESDVVELDAALNEAKVERHKGIAPEFILASLAMAAMPQEKFEEVQKFRP